ncbi:hypothetical protein AB1207_04165 [Kineococcus endophyticus]|uniref:Uncharacterized protein n=1 Tax=Kineococcus endophyticus TaxID=1181883 RepID=A0ABV3P3C3_9ACTN
MSMHQRRVYRPNVWDAEFGSRLAGAEDEVIHVEEGVLISADNAVLVEAIVEEWAAKPPVPQLNQIWSDRREYRPDSASASVLQINFHAPVTGAASLLHGKNVFTSAGNNQSRDHSWTVSISVEVRDEMLDDPRLEENLLHSLNSWKTALATSCREVSKEVADHRDEMRSKVAVLLDRRRRRVEIARSATVAADINLERVLPGEVMHIPVSREIINLEQIEQSAANGVPEYRLTEAIAQSLLATITSFGKALERLPRTASRIAGEDEESIRDVLLFLLNANWRGLATGETFIGEGKSDILLR